VILAEDMDKKNTKRSSLANKPEGSIEHEQGIIFASEPFESLEVFCRWNKDVGKKGLGKSAR
jgi:hypothetical protein